MCFTSTAQLCRDKPYFGDAWATRGQRLAGWGGADKVSDETTSVVQGDELGVILHVCGLAGNEG